MARKETISKETEELLFNDKQKCPCCGEIKNINTKNFYKSYSILYRNNKENRMSICKECLLTIADNFKNKFNSESKGLYELCKLLDVYYEKNLFDSAKAQAIKTKSNPYQIYFQKALSMPQYRDKIFMDSEYFDKKLDTEEKMDDCDYDKIIRWGNIPREDAEFLELNYNQWITRHKCETRAEEILYEQIVYMQLDIKQTRESGGDVVKKVEALQKLMASANIRPLDQNAMSINENMMLWGTITEAIEKNEPCEFFEEEKRKEYKDFKGYKTYFKNWVERPLKNLLASHKDYNIIPDEDDGDNDE